MEVESRAARGDTCGAVPKEAEPLVTLWPFSVELGEGQDKEEEGKNLELRGSPTSFSRYLRHCIDANSGIKEKKYERQKRRQKKAEETDRQTDRGGTCSMRI